MRQHALWTVLLLLLVATAGLFHARRARLGAAAVPAVETLLEGELCTQRAPASLASFGALGYAESEFALTWSSDIRRQAYSVRDWRSVTLRDKLRDAAGQWSQEDWTFAADFDITALASNGFNVFYFAGVDDAGHMVIERWRLLKKVAMPGGQVVRNVARLQIYSSPYFDGPRALGVDPEERFLLFLEGEGGASELFRLDRASGQVEDLFDGATHPLGETRFMARYQHTDPGFGRLWMLRQLPEVPTLPQHETAIVLYDSDNDGWFDGELVDTVASLTSSGVLGPDTWLDNFDAAGW